MSLTLESHLYSPILEIQDVVENFKTAIMEVTTQIENGGLKKMRQRKAEIEDLMMSREEAITSNNSKGRLLSNSHQGMLSPITLSLCSGC